MRLSKLTEVLSMMAATSVALCGASFAQVCPPATPKTNFTFNMVPTLGSNRASRRRWVASRLRTPRNLRRTCTLK